MAIAYRSQTTGSTGNGTSVTINKPAGVVAGDLLLCAIGESTNTAQANFTSSGWTRLGWNQNAQTTSNRTQWIFYKVAGSSEPSSYTFTGSSGSGNAIYAVMLAYSGVHQTDPIAWISCEAGFAASRENANNYAPNAVDMFGNSMHVEINISEASTFNNNNTQPASFTERLDSSFTSTLTTSIYAADRLLGSTPTAYGRQVGAGSGTSTSDRSNWSILLRDANSSDIVGPYVRGYMEHVISGNNASTQFGVIGDKNGDILVLQAESNASMNFGTITGYTNIYPESTQQYIWRGLWWKQWNNESRSVSLTNSGLGTAGGILWLIGNAANSTPKHSVATANNTAPSAPSVTMDTPGMLMWFLRFADNTATQTFPTGFTAINNAAAIWAGGSAREAWTYRKLSSSGATGAQTGSASGTSKQWRVDMLGFESANQPPAAPTLNSPPNAAYANLSAGGTFTWTFNDSVGDTQSAYAFRRKITGAPSYEYWNATTASWQGTEVKNTSGTSSVTFGSGKWTNGNTYVWSVKTWDAGDLEGTYASDFVVTSTTPPTVTVTAPSGSVADTSNPTVTWTYSDPEGDARTHYRLVVETGSYGTTPGSGTTVYDTGVTVSTALSKQIPVSLDQGSNYRAFVQVTAVGGQLSNWGYNTFTISLDVPAPPIVTAVPDDTNAFNLVTIQGQLNMLSANQASLETDTTGWAAGTSTSIARSASQALKGVASLQLTRNSTTGTASAVTPSGTSGIPVVAGKQYSVIASFRPNSTTRSTRVSIAWFNSGGSVVGTTAVGSSATETAGNWVQAIVTATSPVGAAYAQVIVEVLSAVATEVHFVDAISLHPGTLATWYRGGLMGATPRYTLEWSEDGGITWEYVRKVDTLATALTYDNVAAQTIAVEHHEAIIGADVIYRSYVEVDV